MDSMPPNPRPRRYAGGTPNPAWSRNSATPQPATGSITLWQRFRGASGKTQAGISLGAVFATFLFACVILSCVAAALGTGGTHTASMRQSIAHAQSTPTIAKTQQLAPVTAPATTPTPSAPTVPTETNVPTAPAQPTPTTAPTPVAPTVPVAPAQPTATPQPTRVISVPPAPPATPTPRPLPTPTPRPTPTLTLAFTCAYAVDHMNGNICVQSALGAALTIKVRYCSGHVATSRSLQGTQIADCSGYYAWRWTPDTKCPGPATATVHATLNNQSSTKSIPFTVQ